MPTLVMPRTTRIRNCRVINATTRQPSVHAHDQILFRDGRIIDPQASFYTQSARREEQLVDAGGLLVVPGFIDIQLNGAFGVDFSADLANCDSNEACAEALVRRVRRGIMQHGVTSFCPTVISSRSEIYKKVIPLLAPSTGTVKDGAEILGVHLEGPFISNAKYGAHDPEVLQHFCEDGVHALERVYGESNLHANGPVKLVTLAPELPGACEAITELVDRGIAVSIGHSDAGVAEAEAAFCLGATCITHLFNAMRQFHHRDPGLVGALGALPGSLSTSSPNVPYYGLICDGVHVHPNSVRIAYRAHHYGAVLVTDAISAMGLAPGNYQLAGQRVEKTADRVYLAPIGQTEDEKKVLAGSCVTMEECLQNFMRFTGCSIAEAVDAASARPARMLGVYGRKGTLQEGGDADLVMLEDVPDSSEPTGVRWVVRRVFIAGEEVDLALL